MRSLGTQLRHLVELLDGAVVAIYAEQGLAYRPRFTPVMRVLIDSAAPVTIGHIATAAGISQPAATQTIALMQKEGLIDVQPGVTDGRQKLISLSAHGAALVPRLQACWAATAVAAATLEAQLPHPLSATLDAAIAALTAKSFDARIREASAAASAQRARTRARKG